MPGNPEVEAVHRYMVDAIELKAFADMHDGRGPQEVGEMGIEPQDDDWVISFVRVFDKFQGRGIATWMLKAMGEHLDEHHFDTTIHHNVSLSEDGLVWALAVDTDADAEWRVENADRIAALMGEMPQPDAGRPAHLSDMDASSREALSVDASAAERARTPGL